jgi:hypothetical protein
MCVDSCAYRGSAQSKFLQTAGGSSDALDAELDLASVTTEFLAQADRGRVGEMSAADLHNPVKLFGLRGERLVQFPERGKQFPLDRFIRRETESARTTEPATGLLPGFLLESKISESTTKGAAR